jgi:hypothetical protein
MVHHIRADEDKFISPNNTTNNTKWSNREHMFCLIAGVTSQEVSQLLLGVMSAWQDITTDHRVASSGMTPRLSTAAVLSQHGQLVSDAITEAFQTLEGCDNELSIAIPALETETTGSLEQATTAIRSLNQKLIDINKRLTGSRSTAHYLAESANVLVHRISPFEDYVIARLNDWDNDSSKERTLVLKDLKKDFHQLDSYREKIRDNDKLTMVWKCMFQHKTDIKSLQQHIDINVGMVSHTPEILWYCKRSSSL